MFVIPMMETLIDSSNAQNNNKKPLFTRQVKQYFYSIETPSLVPGTDMIWVL